MEKLFHLFYECKGVSTDTRSIQEKALFICLKGDRYDANTFAKEALQKGAKYVISSVFENCDEKQIFYVSNTLLFLQKLAQYHRNSFSIPVIGITGSNGKTSTKELIYSVLSQSFETLATIGNLNNHIGVPLTLLRINSSIEIAIIEMGANKPGDIAELCEISNPSHGIITNIGKAHLEGFKDFQGVLSTKLELYNAIQKSNGTIFYNSDDKILCDNLPTSTQNIGFSENENGNVQGELISLQPTIEMQYKTNQYQSPILKTNLFGEYNFYNFLAAITIGNYFKIPFEKINFGIENYKPSNNRSQILKTERNTLILDCYNANPSSMSLALKSFSKIDTKNKWVILGDMLELGPESEQEHKLILNQCKSLELRVITIGKEFLNAGSTDAFENIEEFQNKNTFENFSKQMILLKGSRGIGLERLITFF